MKYTYQTFPDHTVIRARKNGYTATELRAEVAQNGCGVVCFDDTDTDTVKLPKTIEKMMGRHVDDLRCSSSKNTTNMKTVRTLPTDKKGEVYYGPKTLADAKDAVEKFTENDTRLEYAIEVVNGKLISAGYSGVAAKLRAYYR